MVIVVACICLCASVSVHQPFASLRANMWPIQVRITKLGPEVQNTLDKISVVLGVIGIDLQSQI